ncbi:hypothetical protein BGY98DRAFT_933850 [Russula aff. rugulosa BPL654]|nr:hypothetical protein BGY98DRAFT_933850 [Russula aff. rugulosa BPL654]
MDPIMVPLFASGGITYKTASSSPPVIHLPTFVQSSHLGNSLSLYLYNLFFTFPGSFIRVRLHCMQYIPVFTPEVLVILHLFYNHNISGFCITLRHLQSCMLSDSSKPALPSDFVWYHSKGNDNPMGSSSANKMKESNGQNVEAGLGCIQRSGQGGKMAEVLQYEKADEHGKPIKHFTEATAVTVHRSRKARRKAKKQCIDITEVAVSSDEDDYDYQNTNHRIREHITLKRQPQRRAPI